MRYVAINGCRSRTFHQKEISLCLSLSTTSLAGTYGAIQALYTLMSLELYPWRLEKFTPRQCSLLLTNRSRFIGNIIISWRLLELLKLFHLSVTPSSPRGVAFSSIIADLTRDFHALTLRYCSQAMLTTLAPDLASALTICFCGAIIACWNRGCNYVSQSAF